VHGVSISHPKSTELIVPEDVLYAPTVDQGPSSVAVVGPPTGVAGLEMFGSQPVRCRW